MNKISVKHYFDASHQLTDSPELVTKACARLHGHTYAVEVFVKRKESDFSLNKAGMVIDFSAIKQTIDVLDHRHINDIFKEYGNDSQPTAENIAVFLSDLIETKLNIVVEEIRICEGYKGLEKASWAIYKPYS